MHSSAPKNRTVVRSRNTVRLTRAALQTAYVVSDELGTTLAERLFTTPRRHTRPDRERAILASARELSIPVTLRAPRWNNAHLRVAAWAWGHGPTALLVHGWEGRGSQLGSFVEPLVAAGMSVVAFDAPGHGDSPEHRLYLTDLADTVADVAAAIGPVHAIIAHSFGAAAVLLAHPRSGLAAPRNILLSPNVLIDEALDRFAHLVGLDDTDRIALEARLAAQTSVSIADLALPTLTATRDDALLVIHDTDDREVPLRHGEQLAATWPNATLHTTTNLGHRRILRDPDVLALATTFATANLPAPASDLVREVDRQLAHPEPS
ncbi:MAG: alpha/beta hydrolase [Deltaproteobacteria bacterium]|nr:alpha/beta hydrolase [Deltaproteobacteria bacterium]